MEGEKERERERGEEKESDEAEEEEKESDDAGEEDEEEEEDAEGAALMWQEGYAPAEDDLGLPIMHWEALSLRIAELEKQEEEKKERNEKEKSSRVLERGRLPMACVQERERGKNKETWMEDGEEDCNNSRVTALTSRLQSQMNLQLCFINNSESEEEEDEGKDQNTGKKISKMAPGKKGSVQAPQPQAPTTADKSSKPAGFKFEVRAALSALREKLRTDQKQETPACCDLLGRKRRLERSDLQAFSLKELTGHRNSLSQAIQDLSTELVGLLVTRDQLRTEQDAMLLEVQDMTSL